MDVAHSSRITIIPSHILKGETMDYDMLAKSIGGAYPNQVSMEGMVRMPNMKERLELAVKQAEERLRAVKEAKEIFDRNPDIEKLLDIMQRNHF